MLFMTLKEKYEGMIPYLIFCGRANAVLLLFLFKDNRIHYWSQISLEISFKVILYYKLNSINKCRTIK